MCVDVHVGGHVTVLILEALDGIDDDDLRRIFLLLVVAAHGCKVGSGDYGSKGSNDRYLISPRSPPSKCVIATVSQTALSSLGEEGYQVPKPSDPLDLLRPSDYRQCSLYGRSTPM